MFRAIQGGVGALQCFRQRLAAAVPCDPARHGDLAPRIAADAVAEFDSRPDAQRAAAALEAELLVGEHVQNAAAIVDAGQAIVAAFAQPAAQLVDIPAHEREPREHRGQRHHAQGFDLERIEAPRLIRERGEHELGADDQRGDQQQRRRSEAQHAEEHDDGIDEQAVMANGRGANAPATKQTPRSARTIIE